MQLFGADKVNRANYAGLGASATVVSPRTVCGNIHYLHYVVALNYNHPTFTVYLVPQRARKARTYSLVCLSLLHNLNYLH